MRTNAGRFPVWVSSAAGSRGARFILCTCSSTSPSTCSSRSARAFGWSTGLSSGWPTSEAALYPSRPAWSSCASTAATCSCDPRPNPTTGCFRKLTPWARFGTSSRPTRPTTLTSPPGNVPTRRPRPGLRRGRRSGPRPKASSTALRFSDLLTGQNLHTGLAIRRKCVRLSQMLFLPPLPPDSE